MTLEEYSKLQEALTAVLDKTERRDFKMQLSPKKIEGFRLGVLACKSALNAYKRSGQARRGDWIPITEAEPPLGMHVLVTYKHGEDDYETSELDYGMSKAQNTWHWRRVIAWQPMPEPYEEVTP